MIFLSSPQVPEAYGIFNHWTSSLPHTHLVVFYCVWCFWCVLWISFPSQWRQCFSLLFFPNVVHLVSKTYFTLHWENHSFNNGKDAHIQAQDLFVYLVFWSRSICIWCRWWFCPLEFSTLSRFFICSLKHPPCVIMVMYFNASNQGLSKGAADIEVIKNFSDETS